MPSWTYYYSVVEPSSNMYHNIYTLPYIIFGNHTMQETHATVHATPENFRFCMKCDIVKETDARYVFWQIMSVISFSEYKWIVYWRKHVGELFCCLFFSFIAGILMYKVRMHMYMLTESKVVMFGSEHIDINLKRNPTVITMKPKYIATNTRVRNTSCL